MPAIRTHYTVSRPFARKGKKRERENEEGGRGSENEDVCNQKAAMPQTM
jgi:hypothetical protein